jgi:hypothetical protein
MAPCRQRFRAYPLSPLSPAHPLLVREIRNGKLGFPARAGRHAILKRRFRAICGTLATAASALLIAPNTFPIQLRGPCKMAKKGTKDWGKERVFRREKTWGLMSVPPQYQPISCFNRRILRDSGAPKKTRHRSSSVKLSPPSGPRPHPLIVIGPTIQGLRTIPLISGTFSGLVPSSAGYIRVFAT